MELLTIRESSLGSYTQALQEAILAGYRMSDESSKYPWIDQQYNAVLELSGKSASVATIEVKLTDLVDVQGIIENAVEELDLPKPSVGRPRRKL